MIYVIRSAAFKKGSTTEMETIIKIGYTGEDSKKARLNVYLTENPTIQILYQIEGGSERDEENLHGYFSHLLIYGREWFKEEKEIIDFFETHQTKESLKEVEDWKLSRAKREKAKTNRKNNLNLIPLINISISKILDNDSTKEQIKILENYLWYNVENIWEFLKDEFKDYYESIKEEYDKIDERLKNFLNEFDRDKDFVRRMKLICEIYFQYPTFYTQYSNSPLQVIIPIEYQNYINALGFERIRSLGYREGNIIEYLQSQSNLNSVSIVPLFSVGSKYSTKQIKKILGDFYTSNSISKTPKATDLLEYFELKACQFMEDGKKVNGFVIIAKK